jgi:hypothetical protein
MSAEAEAEADAPDNSLLPHVVDAPDPDEATFNVSPGTLSAAFRAKNLSDDQKSALAPLVAQLAALRDRQAASRSSGA